MLYIGVFHVYMCWDGGIHVHTLLLEGEILSEMSALVVASQHEQSGWIAQLQCPQVEHTLGEREGSGR